MAAPVIVRVSQQTVVRESDGATLLLPAGYFDQEHEVPAVVQVQGTTREHRPRVPSRPGDHLSPPW
jgi:hypothetical protein